MRTEEVTELLGAARGGDRSARERLYALMYGELRRVARGRVRRQAEAGLGATTLVHEAYLKMFGSRPLKIQNRIHFLALSSQVMRQLLVDRYRHGAALRRGGPAQPETLITALESDEVDDDLALAVHEAIGDLAERDPRMAKVVVYRFFGGMTQGEIGEALGVTERTVREDWRLARSWLARRLANGDGAG